MLLVGILEDDAEGRIPLFRRVLDELKIDAVFHDNAPDFLKWLESAAGRVALLSLDHDLGPTRERDGREFDPGTGRDVSKYLIRVAPRFPVIVHSSNPLDGPAMVFDLEPAGWRVLRLPPWGDDWIPTAWARRVRELLGI